MGPRPLGVSHFVVFGVGLVAKRGSLVQCINSETSLYTTPPYVDRVMKMSDSSGSCS
jgi:hypothetical protein